MYIIFGNFGNQTIATTQWAFEQGLANVWVVTIDTGWGAAGWEARVVAGQALVTRCGFQSVRLVAKPSFTELVRDRQDFPSTKFQWCAGFIKGLSLLDWLDKHDPQVTATIVMGKRRLDSRANFNLPERITESPHYGERGIWYPLCNLGDQEFSRLIASAGFEPLPHRSLECDPCVNSNAVDLEHLADIDILKTQALETELNKPLFTKPIAIQVESVENNGRVKQTSLKDMFQMGCGSPFACGE